MTVLARNRDGYKNLVWLNSRAHLDGYYYKPRINKEMLREHKEGLIVLSGCLGSELGQHFLKVIMPELEKRLVGSKKFLAKIIILKFKITAMPEDRKVNSQLIKLAKELDIKLAATNDSHFTNKDDAVAHDCLLCIQMGKLVTDHQRMKFTGWEYIKDGDEMFSLFRDHLDIEHIEEALQSTLEIADKIEPIRLAGEARLPVFPVPVGHTAETYLDELVFNGLKNRFAQLNDELIDRARTELKVINDMNYASYFLIVGDFIQYARQQRHSSRSRARICCWQSGCLLSGYY